MNIGRYQPVGRCVVGIVISGIGTAERPWRGVLPCPGGVVAVSVDGLPQVEVLLCGQQRVGHLDGRTENGGLRDGGITAVAASLGHYPVLVFAQLGDCGIREGASLHVACHLGGVGQTHDVVSQGGGVDVRILFALGRSRPTDDSVGNLIFHAQVSDALRVARADISPGGHAVAVSHVVDTHQTVVIVTACRHLIGVGLMSANRWVGDAVNLHAVAVDDH